jgi:hypothetical protein
MNYVYGGSPTVREGVHYVFVKIAVGQTAGFRE